MFLKMADPLSRLLCSRVTDICWRSFSSGLKRKPYISHSICSANVKAPLFRIQSQHIAVRSGIGYKKIWPFCRHQCFSSHTRSDLLIKESGIRSHGGVVVNCQKGQEVLKDFLKVAKSRGMKVNSREIVKTVDDVISAVYPNGNYPFLVLNDNFKSGKSLGKIGLIGETSGKQMFAEQFLLKDFFTCPEIEPLLSLINENLQTMTASEKAHVYLCLSYLGIYEVHANHPVMHKLFFVLAEPAGELGYEDIRKFQMVLVKCLNPEVLRYKFLLPHLKHLSSVGYLNVQNKQQFVQAISYNVETMHMIGDRFRFPTDFSQVWHALVTDESIMQCPDTIVTILNHLSYSSKDNIPHVIEKDIFDRIEKSLLLQIADMDMRTFVKLAAVCTKLPRYIFSEKLQKTLSDHCEKILHNTQNLSITEMLSIMAFYRMENFCLSPDSLAILTNHMEQKFPHLQQAYSFDFLKMLVEMMTKHRFENKHFDGLMALMKTHSDAEMFKSVFKFEILLMRWKLYSLPQEAFRKYIQINLLNKRGFGRNRRLLPVVLGYIHEKVDDPVMKKDLMDRMLSLCRGEKELKRLFTVCLSLIYVMNVYNNQQIAFYEVILQLINTKMADIKDLDELVACFLLGFDFRECCRRSLSVRNTLSNLVDRLSEVILLPHQRSSAVWLGKEIGHHFYNRSKDFFHLTTPAVDQLVKNILKEEQTCELDCFIALSNLIACGEMSKSRRKELEKFADVIFEENMDFMRIDYLLLCVDNLCLAGVYPKKTLTAILSKNFLDVVDESITKNSSRVVSTAHIEYHLLRLNRAVVLDCPALDIPWFCGHVDVPHKIHKEKHLWRYCKRTQEALCSILGGKEFLSENSTTRFKHVVDFQCFIDADGTPVQPDTLDLSQPLPASIKRVAVDVIPDSIWGNKPDVMYQEKKRHLKKEGYKYIQVNRDRMLGLALSENRFIEEFYAEEIFN
ncbi:uncharacterized protein LOC132546162 [Ylistrum balloti]|uniref:uncharacterized protein LOC132546162 n=1 Tax=Ylistrum balloti TaxID=509963 RepID=UPI002905EE04|nr:uncharacterized protein LOC132546162 [Ylistrum balloti]